MQIGRTVVRKFYNFDHRPRESGLAWLLGRVCTKSVFKKLACLCHIKQKNLTYLGQVCMPCLSVSTGIYGLAAGTSLYALFIRVYRRDLRFDGNESK